MKTALKRTLKSAGILLAGLVIAVLCLDSYEDRRLPR